MKKITPEVLRNRYFLLKFKKMKKNNVISFEDPPPPLPNPAEAV